MNKKHCQRNTQPPYKYKLFLLSAHSLLLDKKKKMMEIYLGTHDKNKKNSFFSLTK